MPLAPHVPPSKNDPQVWDCAKSDWVSSEGVIGGVSGALSKTGCSRREQQTTARHGAEYFIRTVHNPWNYTHIIWISTCRKCSPLVLLDILCTQFYYYYWTYLGIPTTWRPSEAVPFSFNFQQRDHDETVWIAFGGLAIFDHDLFRWRRQLSRTPGHRWGGTGSRNAERRQRWGCFTCSWKNDVPANRPKLPTNCWWRRESTSLLSIWNRWVPTLHSIRGGFRGGGARGRGPPFVSYFSSSGVSTNSELAKFCTRCKRSTNPYFRNFGRDELFCNIITTLVMFYMFSRFSTVYTPFPFIIISKLIRF